MTSLDSLYCLECEAMRPEHQKGCGLDEEMGPQPKSIRIDWIGRENGLVQQDVVRLRRRESAFQTVAWFGGQPKVAKVIGWEPWL